MDSKQHWLRYVGIIACISSQPAWSNGYHFLHQSAEGAGSAYSTNGTASEDISAMFSNPASISRFEGTRVSVGAVLDMPTDKLYNLSATAPYDATGTVAVTGTPQSPEQPIDTAYGAAFYLSHQVNNQWVVGLAVGAPYAYVSDYPDTAVSRYTATKTALTAFNVSPTISYQMTDKLALGAAINAQYYTVELGTMVATSVDAPSTATDLESMIEADDLAVGFSLGLEYQWTDDTRIGLGYRSKISHDFDGTVALNGSDENYDALVALASGLGVTITSRNGGATFSIATPSMLQLGVLHQFTPKFEGYFNANRFGWSAFENTVVSYDNGLADTTVENNWDDSWYVAIGMGYQVNEKLKLRSGFAYDWTPTPASAVSPRAPNNDRWNVGLGMSYLWSDKLKLDLGYQYIKFTQVTIDLKGETNLPRGYMQGNLDLDAHILMGQINYQF